MCCVHEPIPTGPGHSIRRRIVRAIINEEEHDIDDNNNDDDDDDDMRSRFGRAIETTLGLDIATALLTGNQSDFPLFSDSPTRSHLCSSPF